jgi:hypothetical protein
MTHFTKSLVRYLTSALPDHPLRPDRRRQRRQSAIVISECAARISIVALVLLATMLARDVHASEPEIVPALAISVENLAGVPSAIKQEGLAGAERIFTKAGVTIVWCEPHCLASELVRPSLLVRLEFVPGMTGPSRTLPGTVLGSATSSREPSMRVFYDDVRTVADQRHVEPGVLTAYVIAHELGHLLLGDHAHTASGLMKYFWDMQDVTHGVAQGTFSFSADEAARIRRALCNFGPLGIASIGDAVKW